jgi:hypothetical protein
MGIFDEKFGEYLKNSCFTGGLPNLLHTDNAGVHHCQGKKLIPGK